MTKRWLRWFYGLVIRRQRLSDPKVQQVEAFFHALQRRAWSHAVTVRIAKIDNDAEVGFNTGSGVLIEFANGRAIVATAWHVLEEFQHARDGGQGVALVVDNLPISAPRLVFSDPAKDIGVIELPSHGREGVHAVPYRPKMLWPPPRVAEGEDIILCGFPKLLRVDRKEILHGDLNLVLPVVSSSERVLHLQVEWENLVQAGRVHIPPGATDFGGVSGGPCFLVDAECNPLVGLVSQAGMSLPVWRIAPLATIPPDLHIRPSNPL
jgi:hypothetical protein